VLWPADLPHKWYVRLRELRELSKVVHVPVNEMLKGIAVRKGDPLTPVVVKEPVGEPQLSYLKERANQFPGLALQESYLRLYPHGPLAAQLLGYVSEVSPDELNHPPAGVRAGDKIGQAGVETAFDGYLRGEPGSEQLLVDSLGTPRGQVKLTSIPKPGDAVRLTLDLRLQQAAEQALVYGEIRCSCIAASAVTGLKVEPGG
jgi:penicillin-binding protein 2